LFRKNFDLQIVTLLVIIGSALGIAGVHFGAWLAIFGILLVLVLPGYVYSTVLLPQLPFDERMLVTAGSSVVIAGLSGLLLSLTPWGLQASTWAVWLALITLIGVVILRSQRKSVVTGSSFTFPKISGISMFLYGAAFLFVLLAFGFVQLNAKVLDSPLTLLWANYDRSDDKVLNIGVQNEEGKSMMYNVVVEMGGVRVREWTGIHLADTRTFSERFTFQESPQQPISILLFRADVPGEIYRQVRLIRTVPPAQLSRR
jgi:hypothetical protein